MDTSVTKRDFGKRLAQVMLRMDDLDTFLNSLTQMIAEFFEVIWATLSLPDQACSQYMIKASAQRKRELGQDRELGQIDSPAPWLKDRQRIVTRRLLDEFGPQLAPGLKNELNKADTLVSIPLFAGERLIGVLNLGTKANKELFSKEELEMLSEFAELIAGIINSAVSYHNISEQKLHHQNILDNLVSGIIAIDPEDKITVFNRAAERILNFKSEQVLGKDVCMLQGNLANLLLRTLHKDKSFRREELYVLPENILIGVSTSQFYDSKGKLLGACMVFSSLSKIKKRETAMRQQNLDLYWSNVANSLAQEVKNSILKAKVYTEMFPEKYEDAEFRWSLYSTLKRDLGKLDKFSDKVLNFAQSRDLVIQPCQIDKVIDAAISSVLEGRDVAEIALEKRYSPNLKPLPADSQQLKEAFSQIISNALEAMGKEGKLSISVAQESSPQMLIYNLPEAVVKGLPATEIIVVKITDTGCGILPSDLPYLFDPFFTTKEARTGLGLSTARKIAEKHQGIINVESKPARGSTFWVCLPVFLEG